MDHSKYYKHSGQRRPEDRKKDKIKRRSLAQRENRQKILQRTDLSPLKEKNNIDEQPKNRKQMLEDWKKERKRKKFDLKKKEKQTIFKVSSTIKYEDNWYARTSNAATSSSKSSSTEIKPSKAPEKKTKQYSTTGTHTNYKITNSQGCNHKEENNERQKVVKPEKSTKAESAEEIDADDAKLASNVNGADEVQPDTGGNLKETNFQLSHEETHNEKPSENNQIVRNRPQSGSDDKFSESFAPVNHVFKAPAGLKNMTFSAVLPNSNESFVFSANGGSMNFSSSTPFASNQVKRRKPGKAPMIISSASESSSDENTDQTTIKVAKKEEKTSEEREKGGKNVSFASPRNKKRKARFNIEDSDDEKDVKQATPIGSQPRKRVMRKTPLPDELNTSCNEDMQASPTLKLNNTSKEISDEDKNKDEIKGLKLNFDDVQSEEEDSCGLEMKYLLPSEPGMYETN
uniref:disks large-associated protein 5-like isoform X2 n=1 Tax=Styela clava TaxID=7725 RepID=UPI001939C063|nr:disks large-associated protein 5-like isoform X2 [Styela clava]